MDEEVARKYRNHRWVDSPVLNQQEECNYECRVMMFCQTTSGDYDEWQFCQGKGIYDLFNMNTAVMTLEQRIDHAWYTKG